ncbi:multidrug effflux MFS transporter [Bradyrhizobium sp. LHD-71]|uniref:multidrug effflux MFS transporter n=1 Tax=Bradyrhizobium sp. LHD-71 TaxID=3072141 RepID=UPI00280CF19C|nr:multidrug effflux MFS transporter [Bradyrhizobium sp. LHD-71]MDQ8730700.1 multidrug effflux MFS transporter [Bradyrhizobium sp. LHD-71]
MADTTTDRWVSTTHRPMGFAEFVVLVAAIMALNPLAMDMMLPALPEIGAAFHVTEANHLQTVLSTFLLGFGVGQVVIGPLSDRFGRRPVLIGGMTLYAIASMLTLIAPSFETLLLARALQGLSTSATRVIATSVVRDCYEGRRMASVMSLAQMIFISVPVLAPSLGQLVMLASNEWHSVFVVLLLFGLLILGWTALRLPETLAEDRRKSLAIRDVLGYFRETLTNRQAMGYALAAGCLMGTMFAYVFSAQQVFTEVYHLGQYFPLAFAAIALGVAFAGFLNARIVGRLGMRVISHAALVGFIAASLIMMIAARLDMLPLPLYMALAMTTMFTFGLMISNFTSLALVPLGHIAGTASSLFGSITTLIGIVFGTIIGQAFDGTMVPLATGFFACTLLALIVVLVTEHGRLFRPSPQAK